MKAVIRVLCAPAVASGFRLAGLDVTEAWTASQTLSQLERLTSEPAAGVLLVEQSLLDLVPEARRRELDRLVLPILVPIPTPAWDVGRDRAEDYILDMLQRAIGYRVRLQ